MQHLAGERKTGRPTPAETHARAIITDPFIIHPETSRNTALPGIHELQSTPMMNEAWHNSATSPTHVNGALPTYVCRGAAFSLFSFRAPPFLDAGDSLHIVSLRHGCFELEPAAVTRRANGAGVPGVFRTRR